MGQKVGGAGLRATRARTACQLSCPPLPKPPALKARLLACLQRFACPALLQQHRGKQQQGVRVTRVNPE